MGLTTVDGNEVLNVRGDFAAGGAAAHDHDPQRLPRRRRTRPKKSIALVEQ